MPDTFEMEDFEIIILGCGISGLVSASVLIKQGYKNILLIDEYENIGGNHLDFSIGPYTFDVGSLIFQDDSPLLAHFPDLLEKYVPINPSWGKLIPKKKISRYPLSMADDFFKTGPAAICKTIASLIFSRLYLREIRNARDYARFWIGDYFLVHSGLESYMKRFFGAPPENIDLKFAEKRMRWIEENASFSSIVNKIFFRRRRKVTNIQLARPKAGFRMLYDSVASKLLQGGTTIVTGARLNSIKKSGDHFILEVFGKSYKANRLISTIPIRSALNICGLPDVDLSSVTIISLFFSFAGQRGFEDSILYNFTHKGSWKRLTMYSDFYGSAGGREYFTVEALATGSQGSVVVAERDFRIHVAENNLFKGDLNLEGHYVLDNAYPMYVNGSEEQLNKSLLALKTFGVQAFGRQGAFDYQPTARVSTLDAEVALEKNR